MQVTSWGIVIEWMAQEKMQLKKITLELENEMMMLLEQKK